MKNLVQQIKLTEPVKPVQNQSPTVNQQKPQQQGEQASGKNDFQAMLDKQVQDRRLQDKKLEVNKQQNKTAEKPSTSKQAKTEASTKASPKDIIVADQEAVEAEVVDTKTKAEATPQVDQTKQASVKKQAVNEKLNAKADPKSVKKVEDTVLAEKEAKVDARLSEQAKPKAAADAGQQYPQKGVKQAKASSRTQTDKTSSAKVGVEKTENDVVSEETVNTNVSAKQVAAKSKQPEQHIDAEVSASHQQTQTKEIPTANEPHVAQTTAAPVDHRVARTASEEERSDHQPLKQAPDAQKLVKSAEKQLFKTAEPTQVKAAATGDETAEDMEMLAQTIVQDDATAENAPKHSAIAELQRAAMEKRHQAKQLQKDMAVGQLRSAMVKESIGDRTGLETESIPRSDRASDFIQTMSIQAATTKPAAQRPVHSESFKVDDFKAAANKTSETPTPIASTQSTVGANAALQPSSVMAAAPLGSSNQIYAYPGKSGWNQAISQKVMYMVGASEQTARLTLNPPELGPLQVVIEVNDEKADTTFISDNEEVRQALEDGMEHLREKMEEAGISLGQANVNDGQRFNQQRQHEDFAANLKQNGGSQPAGNIASEEVVTTTKVQSNHNGLVDTFA